MFLRVDAEDRRPIYQQVADGIRTLIARGELAEGMALPPVRQIAADLGVNLNTVAAAYRHLQDEGLIAVRHGSGAIVTSRRSADPDVDEARGSLRTALTQLRLAGLGERDILRIVTAEIKALVRGAR
jgi:GntR family transcriptional regulator